MGCGLLVAATVGGADVVRSTSGGMATVLLTGGALFATAIAAVVDVGTLLGACSSTAAGATALIAVDVAGVI